ncbi:MAG: dolichyl-phosphate mannose synthase [Oscillospiraceae bacterium]|nr:dolichyl-phosphate mannose synthase [Oscillospiraceae bacterium]
MEKLHLIMPMGGRGARFFKDGYVQPKPLIRLRDKPFFYWSAQSVLKDVEVADLRFVVLEEHIRDFAIDREIRALYPDAEITVIPEVLPGAVLTCMAGAREIKDGAPLLFNDCDHMFRSRAFADFCAAGDFSAPDGALLTFRSDEAKFSYLRYDEAGRIVGTAEKEVVSNDAICGAYYFKNADTFLTAAERYLSACRYEEFFVSGVYDVLLRGGGSVGSFPTDLHISFGTPAEYALAADDPRLLEVERT